MSISLVEAIARQEGLNVAGSRAARNHNPGNINYGVFASLHGATGKDDKGYAIFPDLLTGFKALQALLKSAAYKGHTLKEVLLRYCPPTGDARGDNNTLQYIENVSKWTGIKADESIDAYVYVLPSVYSGETAT